MEITSLLFFLILTDSPLMPVLAKFSVGFGNSDDKLRRDVNAGSPPHVSQTDCCLHVPTINPQLSLTVLGGQ